MKRDMDLIRLLLLEVGDVKEVDLSSYTNDQILYHSALLIESKYCRGFVLRGNDGQLHGANIIALKWKGHNLLDAGRDEEIWEKVKEKISIAGGAYTMGILLDMLKQELKNKLGI